MFKFNKIKRMKVDEKSQECNILGGRCAILEAFKPDQIVSFQTEKSNRDAKVELLGGYF